MLKRFAKALHAPADAAMNAPRKKPIELSRPKPIVFTDGLSEIVYTARHATRGTIKLHKEK